jgi:hypothetical protein
MMFALGDASATGTPMNIRVRAEPTRSINAKYQPIG